MAIIYCDSAGSNTAPYDTWAAAATTLQTALTAWVSGDVVYVKQNSDVGGSTLTTTLTGGTIASGIPVYSVDAAGAYAKTDVATPSIAITGVGEDLVFSMSGALHGLGIQVNDQLRLNTTATRIAVHDCDIQFQYSSGSEIYTGATNGDCVVTFRNVNVTESVAVNLRMYTGTGDFSWEGGSLTATVNVSGLFQGYAARSTKQMVKAVDMSGSTFNGPLVDMSGNGDAEKLYQFVNCDFPAGINVTDGVFGNDGQIVELISCHSSGGLYNYEKHTYRATLTTDTGVYKTTGFQDADGPTSLSRAITPNAVFKDAARFEGEMLSEYVSTTGSKTITVYTADDFTTAPNVNQAYLEVFSLGSASEVLATLSDSRPADLLATTALTTTSGLWTGAPTHQHKLEATVTVNQAGWIGARVVLEGQDLSGETINSFFYDPELNIV